MSEATRQAELARVALMAYGEICAGLVEWWRHERQTGLPFRHEDGCDGECLERAAAALEAGAQRFVLEALEEAPRQ